MIVPDMQHHTVIGIGVDSVYKTIFIVTYTVSAEIIEWQHRSLDDFYFISYPST